MIPQSVTSLHSVFNRCQGYTIKKKIRKADVNTVQATTLSTTSRMSVAHLNRPEPQEPRIIEILTVHHMLWNKVKDVNYKGNVYHTSIPAHDGYCSVVLPGTDEKYNYLWITQNLNKSTGATLSVLRDREQGNDRRITWIIDNHGSKFLYVGCINTCTYFDGSCDIVIERYSGNSTEIVWTNLPIENYKSKY
jgi:hypothetical protein